MSATTLALVLLLAPGAASADAASTFQEHCALCHGQDGKGSAAGKRMGAKDLTTLDGRAEIARSIAEGKGKMRPFKDRLSAEEIAALSKYVKGLK
jgi:cytochrome c6